jgi:multidrug efflux pump subunit AcrA (membrane-fusion protein)
MKRKKFILSPFVIICFLIICFLIIFTSCSSNKKEEAVVEKGTPVKVSQPFVSSLTDYLRLNANTLFLKKEIVRATFQGYIQKIYKSIGDDVKAGDVLFQLITKESYATDSLKIKFKDATFNGLVNFKAKTNGILTELDFNVGDFVSEGEQLAVVSNPSSLAVMLNVPYQHIAQIKLNSRCILVFPNGKAINGLIAKSLPSVDPVAQTQSFLVLCGNEKNIPTNLNLEIKIPVNTINDAIVLPKSAIQTNETQSIFWIMKLLNDSTAIKVLIKKGIENDSLVQIVNPKLSLDDKIIVDGAYGLPDTAKIIIKN